MGDQMIAEVRLGTILKKIAEFVTKVVKIGLMTNDEIEKIKNEKISLEYEAKEAYNEILKLFAATFEYIDSLTKYFDFSEETRDAVTKPILRGQCQPFIDEMKRLHRRLSERDCQNFVTLLKTATNTTNTAAIKCKEKANNACTKKEKTKWIASGAAATVSASAAAAAATNILGPGLSISLALAAGMGIGYGAYAIAQDFKEAEENFEELAIVFTGLEKAILEINAEFDRVSRDLQAKFSPIDIKEKESDARKQSRSSEPNPTPTEDATDDSERTRHQHFAHFARELFKDFTKFREDLANAAGRVETIQESVKKAIDSLY